MVYNCCRVEVEHHRMVRTGRFLCFNIVESGTAMICSATVARQINCEKIRHLQNVSNARGKVAPKFVHVFLRNVSQFIEEPSTAVGSLRKTCLPDERSVQLCKLELRG